MTSSQPDKSLVLLEAKDWLVHDIDSTYQAVEFAHDLGEQVAVDAIWTVGRDFTLIPRHSKPVKTQLLGKTAALGLADIEMARHGLGDEWLSDRERQMKRLLPQVHSSPEEIRDALSETFLVLGGLVVVTGTLEGIHTVHRNFDVLRSSSHDKGLSGN